MAPAFFLYVAQMQKKTQAPVAMRFRELDQLISDLGVFFFCIPLGVIPPHF